MPIRPELRHHYSRAAGWPAIRAAIREQRAGLACECSGQCGDRHQEGRCGARHLTWICRRPDRPAEYTVAERGLVVDGVRARRIIIGVAHLDHDPTNNSHSNLLAVCQRCHLLHDRQQHTATRVREDWRRQRQRGQLDLVLDLLQRKGAA